MSAPIVPPRGPEKRVHDINESVPDPSTILADRLDKWEHCVGILYDYVDTYTVLTKKQIQSYEKIKKSIATLPKFSRYDGEDSGSKSASLSRSGTVHEKIVLPKGPNKLSAASRSSTMGSSEIVQDALRSGPSTAKSDDVLPSYLDRPPEVSAQARVAESEFAPHNLGIDGLFEMLRAKNEMNLVLLQTLDKNIKENVLPGLKAVSSEIHSYRKKFNHIVEKNEKTLRKIEKTKTKLVADLESAINGYDANGRAILRASTGLVNNDYVSYEKDPFLVKKYFFKSLNEQFAQENSLVEQLITLKEEIFALEVRSIEAIKKTVVLFNSYQISHHEELINNLSIISEEFQLFDDKLEISKFLLSNLEGIPEHQKDDMLLLLSAKLPNDNMLVDQNLKRDVNFTSVADPKLLATIHHDSTVPILKDLITYLEVRKLSLKDRIQKDSLKYDYFALTKLKYLFVFGTDNTIAPVSTTPSSDLLVTSTDREFFKGELEPSLIFYLPKCSVVDDEESEEESELNRSKSLKSKFGSIKKKLQHDEKPRSSEYTIKFVGIDLNHKILNKFSKSAHKRTIMMRFHTREQYQVWNSLIRDMSGDLEETAEEFSERQASSGSAALASVPLAEKEASPETTSTESEVKAVHPEPEAGVVKDTEAINNAEIKTEPVPASNLETVKEVGVAREVSAKPETPVGGPTEEVSTGKDIISDQLNERYRSGLNRGDAAAGSGIHHNYSDDNLSEAGVDSIYELKEAIKKDKTGSSGGRFVEELKEGDV